MTRKPARWLAAAALCVSCAPATPGPHYTPAMPLTPTPDAQFRGRIPPAIERPAAPALEAHGFVLPNGFKVFVVERRQPPIVTLRYVAWTAGTSIPAPMLSEFTTRSLLAAGTLFDNAAELRDVRINAVAPEVSVDPLFSALEMSVGSEALGSAVTLLAKTVRHPTFAELESTRDLVLENVRSRALQIGAIGQRLLFEALHGPSHPLAARPRSAIEQVRGAGATALRDDHARRFRPEASALLAVGAVTAVEVAKLATIEFGSWQAGVVRGPAAIAEPFEPTYGTDLVLNASDLSYLAVGYAAIDQGHPDYWPLRLLAAVLSGNFAARANFSLRHQHALAYAVVAQVRALRAGSCLTVETVVGNDNVAKTWKLLRGAIGDLRRRPLEASELEPARRALLLDLELQLDTNAQITSAMAELFAHGVALERLGEIRRAVAAMTADDVQRVARVYLKSQSEARVVIGRHSERDPQLQAMRPLRTRDPDAP